MRLSLLAPLLLVAIEVLNGQGAPPATGGGGAGPALQFGVRVERNLASGEVVEHVINAGAGDLISGSISVHGLVATAEILPVANTATRAAYYFEPGPSAMERVGVIAPAAGEYRVRIQAFDRWAGGGTQVNPGGYVGVAGTARGSYTLQFDRATVAERMAGVITPVRETYVSPRLRRLSQDLQKAGPGAIEVFWREVAGKGPLVEPIPGNDRDVDVTFLWRETYDTRNVLVHWPIGRADDSFMSRLPGTDIWHKTLRLRQGTRFEYALSVNDRPQDRWATRQLDPLNPRKFPYDPTYPFGLSSVLETPGAPDEQWSLRTPTRRGEIVEKTIASALMKNERPIWIYTPPGYTPTGGPYPLVLLFDGAAMVSNRFGAAPTTFDNLINDGRIRPAIVVFDMGNRDGPTRGQAAVKLYSDSLVQELLPMLRATYPITTNPADIVIGGFSAGGIAATNVAFHHPEVFGNVLSQSGGFRGREVGDTEPNAAARLFLGAPRTPIRFYLEVGLYDNAPNLSLPLEEMLLDETNLQGNRHFRDVLLAKGYDVVYREVGAGHDFVHWRAMLADGLMTLLGTR